jgi:hypothetical protein
MFAYNTSITECILKYTTPVTVKHLKALVCFDSYDISSIYSCSNQHSLLCGHEMYETCLL